MVGALATNHFDCHGSLMSAAWQAQIAGREVGISSALDLANFSRERARLLLEFEF
jgi:hypothetical protein